MKWWIATQKLIEKVAKLVLCYLEMALFRILNKCIEWFRFVPLAVEVKPKNFFVQEKERSVLCEENEILSGEKKRKEQIVWVSTRNWW